MMLPPRIAVPVCSFRARLDTCTPTYMHRKAMELLYTGLLTIEAVRYLKLRFSDPKRSVLSQSAVYGISTQDTTKVCLSRQISFAIRCQYSGLSSMPRLRSRALTFTSVKNDIATLVRGLDVRRTAIARISLLFRSKCGFNSFCYLI